MNASAIEVDHDSTDAELLYAFDAIAQLSRPAFVTFMTSQWPRGFYLAQCWARVNGLVTREVVRDGLARLDVFPADENVWPLFSILESPK